MPRLLVGCETSGIVREAFAAKGWDVWSCDLLPSEQPGNHIQGDVLDILEEGWDLAIFHPPCTYLSSSGLHWNKRRPEREALTHEAMLFVLNLAGVGFIHNPIPRIAIENPVGCISTQFRKPDQIIQPHQFGEDASKATCLWLKNLPKLHPTKLIEPRMVNGRPRWGNQTDSGQNRLGPSPDRWKLRAATYRGIAEAMAAQWSSFETDLFGAPGGG